METERTTRSALLVEDLPLFRKLLGEHLRRLGFCQKYRGRIDPDIADHHVLVARLSGIGIVKFKGKGGGLGLCLG